MSTIDDDDEELVIVCNSASLVGSNGLWTIEDTLYNSLPLFSLQICLMVFTIRAIYFLIKPLKQPKVVAEILGGIVWGPSALGRSKAFSNTIFPLRGKMVLETAAMFGLMYFVFLIGVKMDPLLVKRAGRREIGIGIISLVFPMSINLLVGFYLRDHMLSALKSWYGVVFFGSVLSITSFGCLIPILCDFHLLNSELGRLSSTSAFISDIFGWFLIVSFIVLQASLVSPSHGIWALVSVVALVMAIFYIIRPMALWVVRHTPEGKPVEKVYMFLILLSVVVVGFISDVIGFNSYNGALVLGLAIPDGAPLGAAVVGKLDDVISGLLMPLFYVMCGMKTDVVLLMDSAAWGFLAVIMVVSVFAKTLGTLLPALFYKVPLRDAVLMSLFMNSKGFAELVIFNNWLELNLLDQQSFTILILSVVIITATCSPLLSSLYKPSRCYVVHKRRTIQHSRPDSELRILACVHNQDNVPTIINLLEATYATPRSPIYVIALHLVQLVGRFAPIIMDHRKLSRNLSSAHSCSDTDHIANAFRIFEQRNGHNFIVHPFTSIAPYATMHDDICMLALQQCASLIILPFHMQPLVDGNMSINHAIKTLNQNVLTQAPCSVGVLVDHVHGTLLGTLIGHFSYNVGMIFFGGDDDREALALATRMARHPSVSVAIMRIIPSGTISDRSRERKLDIESLNEFKSKNVNNEGVAFREAVVTDIEETVSLIRSMLIDKYDLLVVGMRHNSNPLLGGDISEWTECPELGFVGDLLASATDFGNKISILVIRQQDLESFQNQDVTDWSQRPLNLHAQFYKDNVSSNRDA